jgi:hypothetical protein
MKTETKLKYNTNMNTPETLANYVLAWNSRDNTSRQALLEKCFAQTGSYVDPHIPKPVTNIHEMNTMIATFQSRLPHRLFALGEPEFHNHVFRLKWKLEDEGNILSKGTFTGEFDDENKILTLICFIDN